jgi:DNA-binding transcriptional MerR regulator
MIRAGLSVGFSVAELAEILSERNAGGAPCLRVRKLAAEKLSLLEAKLRDLQRWRRQLRSILQAWDRLLARTPHGKQARLLETLRHPKSHKEGLARGIRKRRA